MAAFATRAELASHLQVASVDNASADLALNGASQAIRDYCNWAVSQETVAAKSLDSYGGRSIWLPTLLLTAVGPVVELGTALTVEVDYDWTELGRLVRNGRWPNQARAVVVTYTHGYNPVPDSVKDVCLILAGQRYQNPARYRSKTVGGVSWTTAGDAGADDAELVQLAKYRIEAV